jgi:two-component system secretion response regulator SsrB
LEGGASGYVLKTNAARVLAKAISSIMAGEIFLCDDSLAVLRQASQSSAAPEAPGIFILSRREQEVLKRIAYGQATKSIAFDLGLSPKTVETHRQHIMAKLRLDNVADLTRYSIRHGLTPL